MNDFLNFIEKDIATKKISIQTLPIKTKTNIKKLNETIKSYETKYEEYRTGVRNYLLAKSRSFEIKEDEDETLKNQTNEKVIVLEYVKFLLNPLNTYVEKMGFDILIYQLNNYYAFNFSSLNEIINNFFYLTLCYNTGGAWSILSGNVIILVIISLFALALVIYTMVKSKSKFYIYSSALFVSGLIGNLFDRIVYSKVIDFLDFIIFGYDFPVFNVADCFICIGVALMMVALIKEEKDNAKVSG